MSASEYMHWEAFYQLEPFGAERDNMHAGLIAATVWNTQRGKKQKGMTHKDFMFRDPATARLERIRDMMGKFRALAKKGKPGGK